MDSVIAKLVQAADALDAMGETVFANEIDAASKGVLAIKQAQYVGVQGYWLRNSRCWHNCYRQKRASTPGKPAQSVWMECWDEYRQSINDDGNAWAKYAEESDRDFIKTAQSSKDAKSFADTIAAKQSEGLSLGVALFEQLEKSKVDSYSESLRLANTVADVAQKVASKNEKIASDLVDAAIDLVKEAQWWNPKNYPGYLGNIGKGVGQAVGQPIGGAVGGFLGGLGGAFQSGYRDAIESNMSPAERYELEQKRVRDIKGPATPPTAAAPGATPSAGPGAAPAATPAAATAPGATSPAATKAGPIDPAQVVSMMDMAFGNMTWTKPAAQNVVNWLNTKLKGSIPTPPPVAPAANPAAPATPAAAPAAPATPPVPRKPRTKAPTQPVAAPAPAVPAGPKLAPTKIAPPGAAPKPRRTLTLPKTP